MGRVNWRQAWGEALLIVVGVVLALGAEAWWSAQSERAEEQEYLEALAAELGSLKSYAQGVMDEVKTIEAAGRDLLTISQTWPYEELPAPRTSWAPDGFISSLEFTNLVAAKSMTGLDVWEGAEALIVVIDRVLEVIAAATEAT